MRRHIRIYMIITMLFVATVGYAILRGSASYEVNPDAVTGGGNPASSVSYEAPQQAIGDGAGYSASASYRNQSGVVQTPPTQSGVSDWVRY